LGSGRPLFFFDEGPADAMVAIGLGSNAARKRACARE
jgi:hypothetical protein